GPGLEVGQAHTQGGVALEERFLKADGSAVAVEELGDVVVVVVSAEDAVLRSRAFVFGDLEGAAGDGNCNAALETALEATLLEAALETPEIETAEGEQVTKHRRREAPGVAEFFVPRCRRFVIPGRRFAGASRLANEKRSQTSQQPQPVQPHGPLHAVPHFAHRRQIPFWRVLQRIGRWRGLI